MSLKRSFALLFLIGLITQVFGQEALPARPSPVAIASCQYKGTYVKIVYSQPHKRGREIFGSLVPFDQVWRTGANEATEITITRDLFINNHLVNAGTYSLFTIPGKEKWIIILNKDLGLWGSYNYNIQMDLLRFEVPVQTIPAPTVFEPFTIQIEQRNNVADVNLVWDKTKVSFPLAFIEPKP